jgi:hypothetical protein
LLHVGLGVAFAWLCLKVSHIKGNFRCFIPVSAVSLSLFVLWALPDPVLSVQIGTLGVMALALGAWAAIATLIFTTLKALLPSSSSLVGLLVLLPLILVSPTDTRERVENIAGESSFPQVQTAAKAMGWHPTYSPLQARFLDWLEHLAPSLKPDTPVPIFLVAAEGGGLRAAAWTMAVLNEMDRATGGKFFPHVFAMSGVSGGSVGAAYFVECRLRSPTYGNCGPAAAVNRDFLAPQVARLLAYEPFRQVPLLRAVIDPRDTHFERQIELATENELGRIRLASPIAQTLSLAINPHAPILLLNASDATTGRRIFFSNYRFDLSNATNADATVPSSHLISNELQAPQQNA